ncbi:MAG: hypothetical protein JXO44_01425 [Clostridia bacterium]|nr:hypothetical protein [Clostridia bacterium]
MKKTMLKLIALSALISALALSGCTKEDSTDVTAPEDTTHVTEENAADASSENATEATAEDAANEDDVVVYDPDKEDLVFQEFKVSLFKGYSTVDAQAFLKANIKYLGIEKADQAILELEKRLKENQNYYINQLMDEKVQEAVLTAYDLDNNTLDMANFKDETYKKLAQLILDNGYKFFPEEGLFYPIIDYRGLQAYDKYTSDEIRSYLDILARDSDAPTVSDAHLNVVKDELETRILLAEEHMQKFPEGQTFDTIYDAYKMYMQFYTVSMAYMGGFDVETRNISEDLLTSYNDFVTENPNSTSAAIIKEYLEILDENDNKINGDVQDFLQDFNTVVVKHISSITTK